ncbi:7309_t:CDS:2 [Acaulospora morrowiae]|uniref:7309_t:CDS:1 n=1 Tax=Acaulospora morrowiae TaxID=94023 RepID=A0A9N9FVR6_9GLOM|nr:7309_t:CDS:2 [Acaulospora morrowiae]
METSPLRVPLTRESYSSREDCESEPFARKKNNTIGLRILLICISSFVVQTELAQYVQKKKQYHKPYFILWVAHSIWIIVLPLQFAFRPHLREYIQEFLSIGGELFNTVKPSYHPVHIDFEDADDIPSIINYLRHDPVVSYLLKISAFYASCVCLVGYSWYIAVNLTTTAKLTTIYNTSCFWTYVFSIILLGELVKMVKIGAVCLSIAGVIIMSFFNDDQKISQPDDDIAIFYDSIFTSGDLIAFSGAVLYGLCEVLYKKYVSPPRPSILFSNTITGLIGTFTLLFLWIPIPILHWIGVEEFELPDLFTFSYIILIALAGVVFNASFMLVIAFTSPIFAAIGIMLTIPLVAVVDVLVTGNPLGTSVLAGSICIFLAFLLLSWDKINFQLRN